MGRPVKYGINDKYFEKIDTSNKAYMLGFLYADGSVNKGAFAVTISKKDIEVLNFICNELETVRPIYIKKINNGEYACLSISSVKMAGDLIKHGIIKNKTYLSKNFPISTNKINFSAFLRGFFDGDGGIGCSKKDNKQEYYVSFSGNNSVLSELKNYLVQKGISSSKIRFRYGELNQISCTLELKGRKNLEKLYNIMYCQEGFSLSRKKQKYLDFFEYHKDKRKIYYEDSGVYAQVESLYKKNFKAEVISKILGIKHNAAIHIISKLKKRGTVGYKYEGNGYEFIKKLPADIAVKLLTTQQKYIYECLTRIPETTNRISNIAKLKGKTVCNQLNKMYEMTNLISFDWDGIHKLWSLSNLNSYEK